jgi:uncharacterized protein YdeI (YjbR/CyaY-like superfamily)
VYPHKSTGKPRIEYNDAVEEALCFGWIDSTVRNIGKGMAAQKFSPRKPKSQYSQTNIERLAMLAEQDKLMPEVKKATAGLITKKFVFPPDIMRRIRADRQAWNNFQKFPAIYRRIRTAFVAGARNRPAEFKKRLKYLIRMSEKNKMFGFGGIGKYYR